MSKATTTRRRPEVAVRVREDGRVTLPAHIRRLLDLESGDVVSIQIEPLER